MKRITIIGGGASGTLLAVNVLGHSKGAIRCDALNFGLDAAPDGNLTDANGSPSKHLFTLGTALKGVLWESTVIPEIRVQARDLADKLLRS